MSPFSIRLPCLFMLLPALALCGNADLVKAARAQVGVTLIYDPAYRQLDYPGGDLPPERGVCTDVVIRALRTARSIDLQQRVHEDMKAHWSAYPHGWNLARPDTNIDHRRVPNLMIWFARAGYAAPLTHAAADYLPGDIVAWSLRPGVSHVGIVSDRHAASDAPLIVHNIGAGAREEDILFRFIIIGHYRL
jgi:uncharacterized protein YijF (DUF1287 family)